jgi:hypothetical protein
MSSWQQGTQFYITRAYAIKLQIRNVQKMDRLHSKLVCLSKPLNVTETNKTVAYYKIFPFKLQSPSVL